MRPLVIIMLLDIGAVPAQAQEEFLNLLNPEFGQLHLRSDYKFSYFPDEPVTGQHTDLGSTQHDVTLDAPLFEGAADEWAASFRLRNQQFDTCAVFPDSGQPFPDQLWNIRFGTSYRHLFESGWIGAITLTVGSPSDSPFASLSETDIATTAILRVPSSERGAWLFFLNYSSNREFLPGIPIPGFGYAYDPSEQLSAVVTTGFLSLRYRPVEPLTLTATYVAIRTVDVRATYQIARPVRLWVGFDWTNDRFLLADRKDPDERLFYYEKLLREAPTGRRHHRPRASGLHGDHRRVQLRSVLLRGRGLQRSQPQPDRCRGRPLRDDPPGPSLLAVRGAPPRPSGLRAGRDDAGGAGDPETCPPLPGLSAWPRKARRLPPTDRNILLELVEL